MHMQSEQQQRIMGYFIEEAKDHLNTLEQGLLNLQSTIEDAEMVSEVFRAAHSIKGGAAMLGLGSIQRTSHRLEDYFKVLRECPIKVDQKLESLFLRIFDTLQELVDQLQGPFGLTEDKSEEIMTEVEPVFKALNEHLNLLVSQSGATPPSEVDLSEAAVAEAAAKQSVMQSDAALRSTFQTDVPIYLRQMLQLFKQPESPQSRQQLGDLCHSLIQSGAQFDLSGWCGLIQKAQQAIAHPDNSYRTLAPVVIKDIKSAQELVLTGRPSDIFCSNSLENLIPAPVESVELDLSSDLLELSEHELDFVANDPFALPADENVTDTDDFVMPGFDEPLAGFAENAASASSGDTESDADLLLDDALWTEDAAQLDEAEADHQSWQAAFSDDSDRLSDADFDFAEAESPPPEYTPEYAVDLNAIDQFGGSAAAIVSDPVGPAVGAAELNSLADLFEGEVSDLGLAWDEEAPTDDSEDLIDSLDLEVTDDFSDLLFDPDNIETGTEAVPELREDISGFFPVDEPDAPSLDSPFGDNQVPPDLSDMPNAVSDSDAFSSLFDNLERSEESPADTFDALFGDDLDSAALDINAPDSSNPDSSDLDNADSSDLGIDALDDINLDSNLAVEDEQPDRPIDVDESGWAVDLWDSSEPVVADVPSVDSDSLIESRSDELEVTGDLWGFAEADRVAEETPSFDEPDADAGDTDLDSLFESDLFATELPTDNFLEAIPESIPAADSLEVHGAQESQSAELISEDEITTSVEVFDFDFSAESIDAEAETDSLTTDDRAFEETIGVVRDGDQSAPEADSSFSFGTELSFESAELSFDDLMSGAGSSEPSGELDLDSLLQDATGTEEDIDSLDFGTDTNDLISSAGSSESSGELDLGSLLEDVTGTDDALDSLDFGTDNDELMPDADSSESSGELDLGSLLEDAAGTDADIDPLDFGTDSDELMPDAGSSESSGELDLGSLLEDVTGTDDALDSLDFGTDSDAIDLDDLLTNSESIVPETELDFDLTPSSEIDLSDTHLEDFDSAEFGNSEFSLLDSLPADDLDFLDSDDTDAVPEDDSDLEESGLEELDALLDAEDAIDSETATDAPDDFAELDDLLLDSNLSDPLTASDGSADDFGSSLGDSFEDLEALLSSNPTLNLSAASAPATVEVDEFGDLEKLLEDAEQTMGGTPTSKGRRAAPPPTPRRLPRARPTRAQSDQTMRVSVKNLDTLNNLIGELVVNRNSLEQTQDRMRQFLDNLLYQVQQLSDVGQRMRDLYERSLLESSLLSSRRGYGINPSNGGALHPLETNQHSTGANFDALEMDRFTGFHTLSQEMIELIVRVRESASDIDFVVEGSDQVTRTFRQITTQLQEGLTRARMVPFAQTADRLPRAVRDISLRCGKQAELLLEGRDTLIDKMILEQLYDPMTHLVNNAITHGIEMPEERAAANKQPVGRIIVRSFHQGNQTVISITDDGAGIDPDIVKRKAIEKGLITPQEAQEMSRHDVYDLLFHSGFTTRDKADDFAGRGVGMDVVRTNLNEIRGTITTDSTIGKGTTFTIRLPLTLSISKALCCISNRARIAFPMDGVEDMLDVPRDRIQVDEEGRPCILWREFLLPFQPLQNLLSYNRQLGRGSVYGGQEEDMISVVVLRSAVNFLALQIDQVLGEQEIVIKQLEGPVPKPVGIAGATVLGDGRIMPIADVLELIDLSMGRIRRDSGNSLWTKDDVPEAETAAQQTEPTVLIVDDSITVRELLSMTFNKVGYRVEQARDGQEAWEKLRSGLPCDLVFCDIEMPRMDGLELLSRIQKDPHLSTLPIAMLTSRGADRHRQMAVSLGAKGYFTKPYLEEVLLDAAQRMLRGEVLVPGGGA